MNRIKFLFLVLFLPFSVKAFVADSSKKVYSSNVVHWLKLEDTHNDTLTFHNLDTTANGFQNFNPIHTNPYDNARIYLGNLGLATKSIVFQEPSQWGFDLGRNSFSPYLKQVEDLKFYRVLSPYTNLYYIWYRKKEQLFSFSFAQNIGPRINYAVNFTRLVSVGDYARQESDHLNYDASIWYASRNRRYQAFAGFINSSLVIQENGGIRNDSIFQISSSINSEFEPVYLNNASNRINDKHFFLKQTYAFGPNDTIKLDTLKIIRIQPKWKLFQEIRYNNRKDEFRETPVDTGVYANIDTNSTTNDYYDLKHLQNRIGIEHYSKSIKSNRLNTSIVYVRLDNISYNNSSLTAVSFLAEQNFQLTKRTELIAKFENGIVGDYANNTLLQAKLKFYSKNEQSNLSVAYKFSNRDVDLFARDLTSTHYRWYNYSFKTVQHNILKTTYENTSRKFEASISAGNVNNSVYYDSVITPQQLKSYQYAQLQVRKAFKLGKFHLLNQIYLQGSTESDIVRMPLLHTYQSIYFQSDIFKKAMNIRTGFDVRYYTKTKALNYSAATSQFYLSDKSFGDYPIIDFFLTASLKRAVLMMKIDHLNQGFWNKGYYMVDGYPLPDRLLKIGLRWAFYD